MEIICMKSQILFSREKKKKNHQFVICWDSPEGGKGIVLSLEDGKNFGELGKT